MYRAPTAFNGKKVVGIGPLFLKILGRIHLKHKQDIANMLIQKNTTFDRTVGLKMN